MTALLAKYHGDASFPFGDAALVALFALSIYYIGSNTNDDNGDDTGSSRYYYKGITASIVVFSQLTDKTLLPAISPDAAISLMEQEKKFCLEEIGKRDVLTCLQKRSVASLYDKKTGEWNIPNKEPDSLETSWKRLTSNVLQKRTVLFAFIDHCAVLC